MLIQNNLLSTVLVIDRGYIGSMYKKCEAWIVRVVSGARGDEGVGGGRVMYRRKRGCENDMRRSI